MTFSENLRTFPSKHAARHVLYINSFVINEMGGACGAYGGGEMSAQGSGGET